MVVCHMVHHVGFPGGGASVVGDDPKGIILELFNFVVLSLV